MILAHAFRDVSPSYYERLVPLFTALGAYSSRQEVESIRLGPWGVFSLPKFPTPPIDLLQPASLHH